MRRVLSSWVLLAALTPGLASAADAQVGASVTLHSDYRYRGRSLSDSKPSATLTVTYDHPSGFYAGATAIGANAEGEGAEVLGYMDYAGFVVRPRSGPSWDVGAINYNLTSYRFRKRTVDYSEAYAGVMSDHASFHLYYAPDYYQSGIHTLYADFGAGFRLTPTIRVFGHAGVLAPVGGRSGPGTRKERYDFRAGLAKQVKHAEFSLSWTRLMPPATYPNGRTDPPDAVVVAAAYFF